MSVFVMNIHANHYIGLQLPDTADTTFNGNIGVVDTSISEVNEVIEEYTEKNQTEKKSKFRGHWIGMELGLNMLLAEDMSFDMPPDAEFMNVRTGNSWNINLNIPKYSIGLIQGHIGMVTGLGIEWCNYRFHNNNIMLDDNGDIVEKVYDTINITKSKLTTSYLTLPLFIEAQFPKKKKRSDRIFVAAGIIGGLKLGSHTKVVYFENDDKVKPKNKEDFSIRPIKYGYTFRVGYKLAKIYVTYYATPLFENQVNPEVYPFNTGISFTF
jgi:uncharacterized protein YlzI (FlbEa/FlbD family)